MRKKDSLTSESEYLLAKYFMHIADGENDVEILREILAERPKFEAYTVFKSFDKNTKGYIALTDLIPFLRFHNIQGTDGEIHAVMRHIANNKPRINFIDFMNYILPHTKPDLKTSVVSRKTYILPSDTLEYEVQYSLCRIFKKEFELLRKFEIFRKELQEREDFSLLHLFQSTDIDGDGFISPDNIRIFMRRNKLLVPENSIYSIIRRLDKDGDCRLSYMEFIDALIPYLVPLKKKTRYPSTEPKARKKFNIEEDYFSRSEKRSKSELRELNVSYSPLRQPENEIEKLSYEYDRKMKQMRQKYDIEEKPTVGVPQIDPEAALIKDAPAPSLSPSFGTPEKKEKPFEEELKEEKTEEISKEELENLEVIFTPQKDKPIEEEASPEGDLETPKEYIKESPIEKPESVSVSESEEEYEETRPLQMKEEKIEIKENSSEEEKEEECEETRPLQMSSKKEYDTPIKQAAEEVLESKPIPAPIVRSLKDPENPKQKPDLQKLYTFSEPDTNTQKQQQKQEIIQEESAKPQILKSPQTAEIVEIEEIKEIEEMEELENGLKDKIGEIYEDSDYKKERSGLHADLEADYDAKKPAFLISKGFHYYGKNSYGMNQQIDLLEIFKQQIALLTNLEQLKERLALRYDFNLYDGFRIIDRHLHGKIYIYDLQDAFHFYALFPNIEYIYLLMSRYDTSFKRLLSFSDYVQMILPADKQYAWIVQKRPPLYKSTNFFSRVSIFKEETIAAMKAVWEALIETEKGFERIRQKLRNSTNFNFHLAFEYFDKNKKGYFTFGDMKEFLDTHYCFVRKEALNQLYLLYDKSNKGKVDFYDFFNEMVPKSTQIF